MSTGGAATASSRPRPQSSSNSNTIKGNADSKKSTQRLNATINKSNSSNPQQKNNANNRLDKQKEMTLTKQVDDEGNRSHVVFKTNSRAKKLFKSFDLDKDSILTRAEFEQGIRAFLEGLQPEYLPQPSLPPPPSQDALTNNGVTDDNIRNETNDPSTSTSTSTSLSSSLSTSLTDDQIDALWREADINNDGKVSWAEFAHRFCVPSTSVENALEKLIPEKRPTLLLQSPPQHSRRNKGNNSGTRVTLSDMRSMLESVYDGTKRRYKNVVDLGNTRQVTSASLKKVLNQILVAERDEAKKQKREVESWATGALGQGGITSKDADKLFVSFQNDHHDNNNNNNKKQSSSQSQQQTQEVAAGAKIDLTDFFEKVKLRIGPGTGNNDNKKNASNKNNNKKKKKIVEKTSGPQAYTLTTVKSDYVRDFVSEHILNELNKTSTTRTLSSPSSSSSSSSSSSMYMYKCHPPLKHWGDDDRKNKSLHNSTGYKEHIFLSERTKIKSIVKLENVIVMFVSFRTEYTSMARTESLYYCRVLLDVEDEVVQRVEYAEKKCWVDGEIDRINNQPMIIEEWDTYVPKQDELEELSIMPIV